MGIVTREYGPYAKGSRLTTAEMDENFNYLLELASGTSGTAGGSGTSGTSGTSGVSGSSGTSGINGSSGTSGTTGTSGTSGNTPTLKTVNGNSLLGSGDVTIATPRLRVVGRSLFTESVYLINFGAILNGSQQTIDIDILCELWTSSTGNVRIYASASPSSVVGALLLGTYTLPTSSPSSGRFVRRFITNDNSGSGEEGPYSDYYIWGISPSTSILNDSVLNNAQITSTLYGNLDNITMPYLVATVTSTGSSAKFYGWICEYGYF